MLKKRKERKAKYKKIYDFSHKKPLKDLTTALKVNYQSSWENVLVLHGMPNKNVTL